MTTASEADLTMVDTTAAAQEHHAYVDWAAVIGGIVLASAISLVLLTFGSAVGLSFANFSDYPDVAPIWLGIAAASWLLWVEVSSFMAGGYLTGRLRRRFAGATAHEATVRDGAHGLLVWAGALVVGALIAVGGIGAAVSAVGSAAATLTTSASNVADDAGAALDPDAYFIDTLYRAPAQTVGTAAFAASTNLADTKAEAARILAAGAVSGSPSDADKTYLAQTVAANTGLSPADSASRVDEVLAAIDDARAKAAAAAETARKITVLAAFLTAAALLVSAVGAYWAASMGGRHRDEGTVFADVFRRY